jgi:menaquinol-cytochrome c reductase iron-sulfur subunit
VAETPGSGRTDGAPEEAQGRYTGPRAVDPEPPDGHEDPDYITRTRFLTNVALITGGVVTFAILVPATVFFIAPTVQAEDYRWVDIGPLSDFPSGQTASLAVSGPDPEADRRVFLRNRDEQLIALWNRCAHMGCPVAYSAGGDNYVCPCHGGAYDSLGLVTGGPPARPLDRLAVQIVRDGRTIALGPGEDPVRQPGAPTARARPGDRVLLGKPYSIDEQQRVYRLRGPGEPVTGILSQLYPF